MTQQKNDFNNLKAGYEFKPASFRIDATRVSAYLDAVEGDKSIYENNGTVPPMTVAALSMAAMGKEISMPEGAIHVSQEIEFVGTVRLDEQLTSRSKVNRVINRGQLHMLTIGIDVTNEQGSPVLRGVTSFLMPLS